MGCYTVVVAGQTVNLLSSDSGGATPSQPTNFTGDEYNFIYIRYKKDGFTPLDAY